MSKKTCKDCLHCSIDEDEVFCSGMPWHYPFGGSDVVTLDKEVCKHFLERHKPTVFNSITKSPEVLANSLVYYVEKIVRSGELEYNVKSWGSTIIAERTFETYQQAYEATVSKLNEEIDNA